MIATPHPKRLANAVRERRHELGISQAELAQQAQVSERMIEKLERGQTGQRMTTQMSRVERALGWTVGSFERIRDGGEPSVRRTDRGSRPHSAAGGQIDDLAGLPLDLREQLSSGTVRAYEVVETDVGDTSILAVFLRKGHQPPDRDEIRRELEEWARAREALENLRRGSEEGEGE